MLEPFADRPLLWLLDQSFRQFACLGHFTDIRRGRDALNMFAGRWLQVFGPSFEVLGDDPGLRNLFLGRPIIYNHTDWPDDAPAAGYFDPLGPVTPQQFTNSLLASWLRQFDADTGAGVDHLLRAALWVMRSTGVFGALRYVLDLLAHGFIINGESAAVVLVELMAARRAVAADEDTPEELIDSTVQSPMAWRDLEVRSALGAPAQRTLTDDLEHLLLWVEREVAAAGAASSLDAWTVAQLALHRKIGAIRQALQHFGIWDDPSFVGRTAWLETIQADAFAGISQWAEASIEHPSFPYGPAVSPPDSRRELSPALAPAFAAAFVHDAAFATHNRGRVSAAYLRGKAAVLADCFATDIPALDRQLLLELACGPPMSDEDTAAAKAALDTASPGPEAQLRLMNHLRRALWKIHCTELTLAGIEATKLGHADAAEKLLVEVAEHYPYFAPARYEVGLLRDLACDHEGAVRVFTDCILLDPGNWRYWQSLAVGMKAHDSSDDDVLLVKATAALLQAEAP